VYKYIDEKILRFMETRIKIPYPSSMSHLEISKFQDVNRKKIKTMISHNI
jgi:hypothetical protein